MPRDHHPVLSVGFIPGDLSRKLFCHCGLLALNLSQGLLRHRDQARRTFLRLFHLSLLRKIQGTTDAWAGMDGWALLGTSPPCLQPGFAERASL